VAFRESAFRHTPALDECPHTIAHMDDAEADRQAARKDLVLRTIERFNAGEREVREEDADPDCEIRSAMTGSVFRGYDGVRSWMQEIDEQFETWHVRLDEFAHATGERLLVLGSIHFRGRRSGIEVDVPVGWLFEFRGDRFLRLTTFATHDGARQEAGMA
jgi:SnoaL-like domain